MGFRSALIKHRELILYGVYLALLLLVLRWFEFRFLILSNSLDIYIGLIALVFMGLGIWVALKLAKPKKETIVIEKEIHIPAQKNFTFNEEEAERLGLSKRELEVLQLMSEGLSNAEIAERLFVSLNTVKTHSSKLFEKLEVKRRTQAVEVGKRFGLIA
ncbi:helix-turn-helix transcriptional regulator [Flavobacterium album]|uniref:Helix-turn-helix transcriptional regulator n=1 Tax=Flavobacterium album TaxID=2175091 RepID=A0A2S1QYG4_9FLAO|nr:response regulator transcription factor [Flavobacterium album]AWH85422.1 helix-turn-helix transcriptional regulator [Flavobacterium album]